MKTKEQRKTSEREHGVIEGESTRKVGMDPLLARQVIREEEDLRYPLQESSLEPPEVLLEISDTPHAKLVNGLGANWSPPGQGEEAFPDDEDEVGWGKIFSAMTASGISWVRYWLPPGVAVSPGNIEASHRWLKRLDRLDAWATDRNAGIMLELSTVPQEFQGGGNVDSPVDNQLYVDRYILPLIRHILVDRGCRQLRQLCLFNEPFNADVRPYIYYPPSGKDPLCHYLDLHERLRAALDKAGFTKLGLIGPNSANLFQRHVEMFEDKKLGSRVGKAFSELDCHLWRLRFDYYPASKRWPGYTISEGIERYLVPTLAAARRLGKELSLTECGAMYFNEDPCTSRNTQHDAFLCMAEAIVRSVNAGIAGAMVWSFTNSGRIDGKWGWLKTRESDFAPVPNLLNGFTVLMRHHLPGAQIHKCEIRRSDFSSFISAGALVMPDYGETIWLINDHPVEKIQVSLRLPSCRTKRPLSGFRKGFGPEIERLQEIPDAEVITCVLPGMSLTTLTTARKSTETGA